MMNCDVVDNSFPSSPSPQPFCLAIPPKRNPADCCFSCGKGGHWARECPNKTPKKSHSSSPGLISSSSSSSNDTCDLLIRCPCGRGSCRINTSKTEKNPNRRFYVCPGGKSWGCGFFKWCDELNFRAPICPCKAGICSLNTESNGPNQGKWYFACLIKKGQGACEFIQWADSEVNTIMNTRGHSSVQSISYPTSNDLDKKEVSSEMESPVIIVRKEQDEVLSSRDLVMQEAESGNPIARRKLQVFHPNPMFQSESRCLKELMRQISAGGNTITSDIIHQILGVRVYGWLGRLAFPPSQCPKDAPVMPFFCCIFPSFDPVTISEDADMPDIQQSFLLPHSASNAETDIPPSQTPGQDAQLLGDVFEEPLGLKDSSGIIQNDNGISKTILKTFGQALLSTLESLSPPNHEVMVMVAEATFNTLKSMSIQCDPFVESVKEYIHNVSRVTSIQESMPKGLSSQELAKLYDSKKLQFNNVSRLHTDTVAAYRGSNNRLQTLHEEVSHIKSTLFQLEKQLIACEKETSALKAHVDEVSKDMLEAKMSMDTASNDMVEALDLEHEKESVLDAAGAALETARFWIEQ